MRFTPYGIAILLLFYSVVGYSLFSAPVKQEKKSESAVVTPALQQKDLPDVDALQGQTYDLKKQLLVERLNSMYQQWFNSPEVTNLRSQVTQTDEQTNKLKDKIFSDAKIKQEDRDKYKIDFEGKKLIPKTREELDADRGKKP